jgi:hypothetical protein
MNMTPIRQRTMKPNIDICRTCACERHIVWRSKTDIKIKTLTKEQVYKLFDKNIKRHSGLVKWCPATAEVYIVSGVERRCSSLMRVNRDFDENDDMAPKSRFCPYFTEQVISNEA